MESSCSLQILRWEPGRPPGRPARDFVATEEPLELRIHGRGVAVLMRTPGQDEELAAGFLLSEGIVAATGTPPAFERPFRNPSDRTSRNTLEIRLPDRRELDWERLTRHVFTSSSCGLCGKAALEAIQQNFPPLEDDARVPADLLCRLPSRLRKEQPAFQSTGGLHASALFDPAGETVLVREDVGRHNALDKVLGRAFLDGRIPLRGYTLLVSGRVSFEIMQKALAGAIPVVAGIGAPTSLAVEFARSSRQTLVGFLREDGFNVYAHPERIDDLSPA